FKIAENVLTITDENGVETLKFKRMNKELLGLADVRWELAKVESVPDGKIPEAYLEINSKENRLGGNSGCNGFGGNFEVSGDSIRISGIISTMMACENLNGMDHAFLKGVEETDRFEIEGEQLRLYKGSELLLTFKSK